MLTPLFGTRPFWNQNRLENTDSAIFSQINVQTHHWRHHFEACRPPDESLHAAQAKEPLVPAALLHFFSGETDYLVLEELSDVPVVLVVPVVPLVPVVPVVVFFFVEESPPTMPPSTRTGVNDVAIWSRNSF